MEDNLFEDECVWRLSGYRMCQHLGKKGLLSDALVPLLSFRSMVSETSLGILPYSLGGVRISTAGMESERLSGEKLPQPDRE